MEQHKDTVWIPKISLLIFLSEKKETTTCPKGWQIHIPQPCKLMKIVLALSEIDKIINAEILLPVSCIIPAPSELPWSAWVVLLWHIGLLTFLFYVRSLNPPASSRKDKDQLQAFYAKGLVLLVSFFFVLHFLEYWLLTVYNLGIVSHLWKNKNSSEHVYCIKKI